MEYLSKEGYNRIKEELDNLIGVEFPKIKDAISEARAQGKISLNSPIGKALMGHRVGDVVEVRTPTAELRLRIEGISEV